MGLEIAGEVVAFGERVSRWKVGDSVCALLLGGGYAAVDARHVSPVPQGLTIEQAAGLPETVLTVFGNVFERGNLKAGKTLLIQWHRRDHDCHGKGSWRLRDHDRSRC
jgi:NADPH2:quinone reductase